MTKIPLYTLSGVPNATATVLPFSTDDGLGLTLTRFCRDDKAGESVLLIHGLTQSSDMFIMPEHQNLVTSLLDSGFGDVWCVDSRMSNHFPYGTSGQHYNLDDVALYDHPATIKEIRRHIGGRPLHVICHCLGSVSFFMSLVAGKIDNIASIISNSVSLTPHVPTWALAKLSVAPNLFEYGLSQPYCSPAWGSGHGYVGRAFAAAVRLTHHECDVMACRMLSVMWGVGKPAMYSHENLSPVTHQRIGDLHGGASFHYYRHVLAMARQREALKYDRKDPRYAALPDNYLACASKITSPVLFVTGANNHVFTDSNIMTHRLMEALQPGKHQLHVFANYGHTDTFLGRSADRDIFPTFLQFLRAQRRGRASAEAASA